MAVLKTELTDRAYYRQCLSDRKQVLIIWESNWAQSTTLPVAVTKKIQMLAYLFIWAGQFELVTASAL